MFDKKKYYNQSKVLENVSIVIFTLYCVILSIIGTFTYEIKGLILGLLIAIITGYMPYLKMQIKVQEIRMMLEIHSKLINKD